MKNITKLRKMLKLPLNSLSKDEELRLESFLEDYGVLALLGANKMHHLKKHSVGVSRISYKLTIDYCERISFQDKEYVADTAAVGGFLHDIGKVIYDKNLITEYDSVKTELMLRVYQLLPLAQTVRHNPHLFLFDWRNGNLTVPQLIVAYADTLVNSRGRLTGRKERLAEVLKKQGINKQFQKEFWRIVENIYNSGSVRQPINHQKIGFIERCDGRYRVVNNKNYLGTLSSYHLAKTIVALGYSTTIISDSPKNFLRDGVQFQSMGKDPLTAFNVTKHNDIAFVTGWTSLFKLLVKSNNVLPLIVMRSLKAEALTNKRLDVLKNKPDRVILVSESSRNFLNGIASGKLKSMNIIPNGVDKRVFYYRKKRIKQQFLYVGSVVKEKGVEEVYSLASSLPDLECLVVGTAEMYGTNGTSLISQAPGNVRFLGQRSQDEIAEYYNESLFSVAFTNKELIFETFGKSAVESQVCGCPVLALNNGGLRENVLKNELNYKVDKFDKQVMTEFVNKNMNLFKKASSRMALSKTANLQFLNWDVVAVRYLLLSQEKLLETLRRKLTTKSSVESYLFS